MRRALRPIVLILVAILMLLPLGCGKPPAPGGNNPPPPPPPPPKPKSAITGLEYEPSAAVPLFAVMVENHEQARPQSGLIYADLVYEAQAEGGITRFMAIYSSRPASTIGPVRSARPYYVQLASEWGAAYAHCGGSPDGLALIKSLGLIDLDDMSGAGFWRDKARSSPHNLYTSTDNLIARLASRKTAQPTARWQFGSWAAQPAAGLDIEFGYGYKVSYNYRDHSYERSMNGKPHADRETKQIIAPANIIVQVVKSRVVDKELRLDIEMISSGKAIFLTGGVLSEGTWSKASDTAPTKYQTADGKELVLAPGQTWIEIVPTTATVTQRK